MGWPEKQQNCVPIFQLRVCKWIAARCVNSHWILSSSKNRNFHIWIPKFISLSVIPTCAITIQTFICDQFLNKDLKIPNPTVADAGENRKEMGHIFLNHNAVPKNNLLPGISVGLGFAGLCFFLLSSYLHLHHPSKRITDIRGSKTED